MAVYRPYDADGALLYVGISKDFGRRWQQHAGAKPWWPQVERMTVEWHDDEASAQRAEVQAIELEHPRYNVARTNAHYRATRNPLSPLAQPYMGAAEIAEALGVGRQRVQQIAAGADFPMPFDVLTAGRIWRTPDVETWARDHGRALNA